MTDSIERQLKMRSRQNGKATDEAETAVIRAYQKSIRSDQLDKHIQDIIRECAMRANETESVWVASCIKSVEKRNEKDG